MLTARDAHRARVWFDHEVRQAHRQFRQSIPAFLRHSSLRNLLTAPVVYTMGVPLVLLDVCATAFQWICFPIYGIERVRRRPFFAFDRHKLGYLNAIEKMHCAYCSYATGVLGYAREITARAEHYWCPIKHAMPVVDTHGQSRQYFDYGDAAGYRNGLIQLRKKLRPGIVPFRR